MRNVWAQKYNPLTTVAQHASRGREHSPEGVGVMITRLLVVFGKLVVGGGGGGGGGCVGMLVVGVVVVVVWW